MQITKRIKVPFYAHNELKKPFEATFITLNRGGGTGCAGCAIAHQIFAQIAALISFQGKKEFFKSVKN